MVSIVTNEFIQRENIRRGKAIPSWNFYWGSAVLIKVNCYETKGNTVNSFVKLGLLVIVFGLQVSCSGMPDNHTVTTEHGTYQYYHNDKEAPVTIVFE